MFFTTALSLKMSKIITSGFQASKISICTFRVIKMMYPRLNQQVMGEKGGLFSMFQSHTVQGGLSTFTFVPHPLQIFK
jgi:hypothetical protein